MSDKEILNILAKIKAHQDSIGIFKETILQLLLEMLIPIDVANNCFNEIVRKGLLHQSSLNNLYSLTPKAESWLNDFENKYILNNFQSQPFLLEHRQQNNTIRNIIPENFPEMDLLGEPESVIIRTAKFLWSFLNKNIVSTVLGGLIVVAIVHYRHFLLRLLTK